MRLLFDQRKVPRSTSRAEWREIDRWCRTTRRELAEHELWQRDLLAVSGSTNPMRAHLIDAMINPPLVLGPHQ